MDANNTSRINARCEWNVGSQILRSAAGRGVLQASEEGRLLLEEHLTPNSVHDGLDAMGNWRNHAGDVINNIIDYLH